MKQYTIDRLIDLHKKQTYLLEIMRGQTGPALQMLAEMYKKNAERIIYLINSNEYKETPAHPSRS